MNRSSSRLALRHNPAGENQLSKGRYLERASQTFLVVAARQSEMPAGMLIPWLGAWLALHRNWGGHRNWDGQWDWTQAVGIRLLTQDFCWERGKKGPAKFLIRGIALHFECLSLHVYSLIPKVCFKDIQQVRAPCWVKGWQMGNRWLLFAQPFVLTTQRRGCSFFSLILWCFIEQNGELWFKLHFLFTSQSFLPTGLAERLSSSLNYLR